MSDRRQEREAASRAWAVAGEEPWKLQALDEQVKLGHRTEWPLTRWYRACKRCGQSWLLRNGAPPDCPACFP